MTTTQDFREGARLRLLLIFLVPLVLPCGDVQGRTEIKFTFKPAKEPQTTLQNGAPAPHLTTVAAPDDTSGLLDAAEIEEEYAIARRAYKSRDWVRALVALEMIVASNSDYRDVNEMIAGARRGLENDSTEVILGRHYVEGLQAKRAGDYARARQAFRAAIRLQHDFRDVAVQLAEVELALKQRKKSETAPPMVIEAPRDSLYAAARAAAKRGAWEEAVTIYARLEAADPENQELRKQAEHAQINFMLTQTELARVEATSSKARIFTLALVVGGMAVALGLIGFAFSSRGRAQYYIMRGKYRRAEQVYESMLQRAPRRLSAYPLLAHLYLRTGRTDNAAMKVFRVILDLNLPTPERDNIVSLIEQNMRPSGKSNEAAPIMLGTAAQGERKLATRENGIITQKKEA